MFIEGNNNTEDKTISDLTIDFKASTAELTVGACARSLLKEQGYDESFLEFIPDDLKSKNISLGLSYDIDEIIPDIIKQRRFDINRHQDADNLKKFLKDLTQKIYYTDI